MVLAAVTAAVYAPVRHYIFVDFDDVEYVAANPHVTAGLTTRGVVWAFTTGYASNWHPVTWLSHMMDVQLYGMNPGGHHLTNVLLHIANSLLLFGLLHRLTGASGRSAFVAAVFALHPLHVESVAWIAERKDVLSTFFWMLTVWAYVAYVQRPKATRYLVLLGCFTLGLMSKPMLVTLPFVLLLLDIWPLERSTNLAHRLREKVPLLLLAVGVSVITVVVQRRGPAFASLIAVPLRARAANAVGSYVSYIDKALWPTRLAVFYPYPPSLEERMVVANAVVLLSASVLVFLAGRRCTFLRVGWLWYLCTLIPVIGLVQVGSQSTADRYMYVPLIGLLIIVAWGVPELVPRRSATRAMLPIAAGAVLIVYAVATRAQLRYWQDSVTLWQHTVDVTTGNPLAQNNLGVALEREGKPDEALAHYIEAAQIGSVYYHGSESPLVNMANVFLARREFTQATAGYSAALRRNPNAADAHNGLGSVLGQQGNIEGAIGEFTEAIRLKPNDPKFHYNLAQVLERKGRIADAVEQLKETTLLDPTNGSAQAELAAFRKREKMR